MAAFLLLEGALGVGETHTETAGRELVRQLLKQDRVKNFFLELPGYAQPNLDRLRRAVSGNNKQEAYIGAYGMSVSELPQHASPSLGELARTALRHGTNVFLADPLSYKGSTDRALVLRNKKTAEVFKETLGVRDAYDLKAKGSLLLFGSDHFRQNWSLCLMIKGLRWVNTSSG